MVYTETELNKLKRDSLVELAGQFGIEVNDEVTRLEMIASILEKQGTSNENDSDEAGETSVKAGDGVTGVEEGVVAWMVLRTNVVHNGETYLKGQSVENLDENVRAALLEGNFLEPYQEPKTEENLKEAIESGEKSLVFIQNVVHNGEEFTKGQNADELPKKLKREFSERGFIHLK